MAAMSADKLALAVLCGLLVIQFAQSAANPCPRGWRNVGTGHSAQCFKLWANQRKNFNAANNFCKQQGGYLSTDTSTAVHNNLKRYIYQAGRTGTKPSSFWIGLTDNNKDAWVWIGNNHALGHYQVWTGRHVFTKNKQDCVFVQSADRNLRWRATNNCNTNRAIVCQRNVQSVRPTTTRRPRITCDSGWTLYSRGGGTCVRLYTQNKQWIDARSFCQGLGGDLIQILDQRFSGWVNGLVAKQSQMYWIGLHDRHKENKFEWLDQNTTAKYFYWGPHQPDNAHGAENCVMIHRGMGYKWNDAPCATAYRFICQKPTKQAVTLPTSPTTPPSRNCGAGWEDDPNTDSCYQLNDDTLSWLDARKQCQASGGDLASITKIQEQYYLSARTISFSSNFFWIGANDRGVEGGWGWTNNQPMAFLNWAAGQPNNAHNSDCVAMVQRSGRWNDFPCQNRYGYICEKKGRVTSPTPRPTTSPARVPSDKMWGCGLGWRGYRGSCYQVLKAPNGMSWSDAKSVCSSKLANLATITNAAENSFIYSLMPKNTNDQAWIGLNDQLMENSFQWVDQLPVTYTNWAPRQPNNVHNEDCVSMIAKTGKWGDNQCTYKASFLVCKTNKALHAKSEREIIKGCTTGIGYGARCYTFFYTSKNYYQASSYCRSKHGDLATVNDRHTQAFIAAQLQPYRPGATYWIGLQKTGFTKYNYTWNNYPSLDFTNWDKSHTGNENNTCVAMRATTPVGLWVNQVCGTQMSFICENPRQGFTTPKPTTTTTVKLLCPRGWWTYNNLCVKAFQRNINTSLSWTDAQAYCSSLWQGGSLATIRSRYYEHWTTGHVTKGLKGSYWIGLNDRSSEGGYEWVDGQPFRWSHWDSGEPNNMGGNEDCVQWNLDKNTWNDATCYTLASFICQVPRGAVVTTPKPVPTGKRTLQCGNDTWLEYNQNCYFISQDVGDGSSKTWFESNLICQDLGGNLVSILNDDENAFVTQQVGRSTFDNYWIGLNDLDMDTFKWTDLKPISFVNWATDEPNDAFGAERCVEMNPNSFWNDEHCQEKRGYVCKKRPGDFTPPVHTSPSTVGGCPSGWHSMPGLSKCYYIGGTGSGRNRKNYTDAQAGCDAIYHKSMLASIHNTQEEKFITVLLFNNHLRWPAWMGFNDQKKSNQFAWIDNTQVDYSIWAPRQPDENLKDHRLVAKKDCVQMAIGWTNAGKWYDDRCRNKYAYVCEIPKSTTYVAEQVNSTGCPNGYSRFRDSCYSFVSESYTWDQANSYCGQVNQGALVSIQDRPEMYFVDLLTRNKGANLQLWLGLRFNETMGAYKWADGWPTKYTVWARGEPDRRAGEGCVSHTMDDKWQDVPCLMTLNFVCEVNLKPAPTVKVPPTAKCQRGWVGQSDYCYILQRANLKQWSQARFACQILGGTLASVHTDAEAKFLTTQITRGRTDTWIGMARGQQAGYSWADSTAVNYLYWSQGEPSDASGQMAQDCVVASRQDGSWRTTDCNDLHAYICKKELYVGAHTTHAIGPVVTIPDKSFTGFTGVPVFPTEFVGPTQYVPPVIIPTPYHPPVIQPTYNPGNPTPYHPPYIQPTRYYPPWVQPTNQPWNQPQSSANGGSAMSGGSVAGIVIGTVAIVAIAVVLVFMIRSGRITVPYRRQVNGPAGFDNATYSNQNDQVKLSSDA